MSKVKQDFNKKTGLANSTSRRTFLKTAIAGLIATTLNIFPEFASIVKATTFYNCYTGGTYYCCDVTVGINSCSYDMFFCAELLKIQFYAICGAVFGCDHTCANECTGPWYTCGWFCTVSPSCMYCNHVI